MGEQHLDDQARFASLWKALDTALKKEDLGGIEGLGLPDSVIEQLLVELAQANWALTCQYVEVQWWYADSPRRVCLLPLGHGNETIHCDERGLYKERTAHVRAMQEGAEERKTMTYGDS